MRKAFLFIFILSIIQSNLFAAEIESFDGRKLDIKNSVDPLVVDVRTGPYLPKELFLQFSKMIADPCYSAVYRVVITNAEIYRYLSVDLLVICNEGDGILINSFALPPLSGYMEIDFIKWNSYNSFKVLLDKKYEADVTILPNGKFTVSKRLIPNNSKNKTVK